jgi:hypothetical protein
MVELRRYLSDGSEFIGDFPSLKDAWKEAYRITTLSKYNIYDFFTMEHKDETNNRM